MTDGKMMRGSAPYHPIQGTACRHFADVRLSELKMGKDCISECNGS